MITVSVLVPFTDLLVQDYVGLPICKYHNFKEAIHSYQYVRGEPAILFHVQ